MPSYTVYIAEEEALKVISLAMKLEKTCGEIIRFAMLKGIEILGKEEEVKR